MTKIDQIWTNSQFDEAKQRWLAGESASRIAKAIGKTTRSVISKMRRAKLSKDDKERRIRKIRAIPRVPVAPTVMEEPPPPGSRNPLTLLKLKRNSCRAILGDVGPGGFALYCGDPQAEGSSWCLYHFGLYTQPPKEREANG